MDKFYVITLFMILALSKSKAQTINVTYDYSSVEKLIEIFDTGHLNDKNFKELISLHGTQAYLKKLSTFFSGVNEISYRKSLEAALNGTFVGEDPYMLKRLVPLIPDAKKLLLEVTSKEIELTQAAVSKLEEYSPDGIELNANVHLIMGIIGGGWTFDDSPNSFYIDFSSMKGDFKGLSYLSTHELYHLIQYRFMKDCPKNEENKVGYLLDQIVKEGSATFVADFSKVSSSGAYIDFSKKEYENNFRRMKTNFELFEIILFQAKNNPATNIDALYDIGYSGRFQSPLYYVGYHIMKLIEKYKGKKALINLLSQLPETMILTYNELCLKHASNDKDFIFLSESTIDILKN